MILKISWEWHHQTPIKGYAVQHIGLNYWTYVPLQNWFSRKKHSNIMTTEITYYRSLKLKTNVLMDCFHITVANLSISSILTFENDNQKLHICRKREGAMQNQREQGDGRWKQGDFFRFLWEMIELPNIPIKHHKLSIK